MKDKKVDKRGHVRLVRVSRSGYRLGSCLKQTSCKCLQQLTCASLQMNTTATCSSIWCTFDSVPRLHTCLGGEQSTFFPFDPTAASLWLLISDCCVRGLCTLFEKLARVSTPPECAPSIILLWEMQISGYTVYVYRTVSCAQAALHYVCESWMQYVQSHVLCMAGKCVVSATMFGCFLLQTNVTDVTPL